MHTGSGRARHLGRNALALLCALLLTVTAGMAESINSVTVESAPLTAASSSLDGMVRVYLSSLGSPTTLSLTIAGSYSLSTGTALTNGETVTVGFSTATGAITLTRSGVKTNMGTSFSLRRHSAAGTNGIKIAQGRKPDNPYPGDLTLQAVQQSSGSYKLYAIANVYLENYLYGVLPYEMGSSAAAEALKAQAVAARTYTVRMMASRAGNLYDVVDTTSDQVYNGTPSGYATCVAAVDATKGIVLKNSGAYTATYYSASNGGQMESIRNIWGSTGYSYLNVKDDPFDYANPDSVVKRTTVYASVNSSANNASLVALLKTKAITALNASGYNATTGNTTLGNITAIVMHTPMYASPSKLYTKADFTLTATTLSSGGSQVSATVTVTCGVFTELESLLGMSIQSSQNELWSVVKNSSTFVLEARRYGHGLGLSQRGAMYMGKLGYTYDEILGFYFEGSTRVGCTFTNTILAAGSTEVITTEETSASVDDGTETSAACTAVVTLVSSSGSLALRSEKSTTATMVGVVANSTRVTVYSSDGTWCLVGFGSLRGYVPANALVITGTAPASSDAGVTAVEGFATVTANGYLNLRSSGSYSASILTTAPSGAVLTVLSKTSAWANVQYGSITAYASTDFLTVSATYPGTVISTGDATATILGENGGAAALRATASTSGTVLAQLAAGLTVTVARDDGSWATVTYNGQTGYVLSTSLNYGNSTSGSSEPDNTEQTVTVSVALAYLKTSADETSSTLTEIAIGQSVVLISQGATWSAVRYNDVSGYILTASLNIPQTGTTASAATVTTQSGSLNLRSAASAGSTILTTVPRGTQVTVTSRGETWSAITYNGYSGFVMTAFLQFTTEPASGSTDTTATTTATVTTASGSLNLRQEAKAGSTILTTIPRLATVTVYSQGAEWCSVSYAGINGYAMTAFLTIVTASQTPAPTVTATVEASETPNITTDTATPTLATDTVTPVPTPTVAPTDGSVTAIVTTESGSLNLRAEMLPGSRVLTRIPQGTVITILQKLSAWSQTTYAGYTGYVVNSYLTFPTGSTGESGTQTQTATVLTATGSLNLRSAPYGTVLGTIPPYTALTVYNRGSTWCYVFYGGQYGYVMTQYLSFTTDTATATPTQTSTPTPTGATATEETATPTVTPTATITSASETITATVLTPSGSLNLRATASTSAQILTTIPRLTGITVMERGSDWCKVLYGAYAGYVQSAYLSFAANETALPTATPTAGTTGQSSTAWVYTTSGSLNLRATASTSASVVTTIPRLAQVTVFTWGDTWSYTQYGASVGYAMTAYLVKTQPAELGAGSATTTDNATASPATTATATEDPTLQAPSQTLYATITPKNGAITLPMWSLCAQQQSAWLLDMLRDCQVEVLRKGDTWCEVLYFEQKGYCLTEGLTMIVP